MSVSDLYDQDFYEWTVRNAELLRTGRAAEADLAHIAEEIEDMGKRERRELISRLEVLITHLLKWRLQPDLRSRSWSAAIAVQRREIAGMLEEAPSLRPYLEARLGEAYRNAARLTARESGLSESAFSLASAWDVACILDDGFLPD